MTVCVESLLFEVAETFVISSGLTISAASCEIEALLSLEGMLSS